MPRTARQCPKENSEVRFRVKGDTKLWDGVYTATKGFEVCSGFLCYTMTDVDYWRYAVRIDGKVV